MNCYLIEKESIQMVEVCDGK